MVAFLQRLEAAGEVRAACAAVGLSARSAYKLRDRNPAFARGWAAALGWREARERRAVATACAFDEDAFDAAAPPALSNRELCRALGHVDDVLARRTRQRPANLRQRGTRFASTGREL